MARAEAVPGLAEDIKVRRQAAQLAADDINVVRTRAARPGKLAEMQITAAQIDIDRILFERALELDGEQLRWFDLTRTNKLLEYVKKYGSSQASGRVPAACELKVRTPLNSKPLALFGMPGVLCFCPSSDVGELHMQMC
ncbi:MAG TPA: RagB/SusD family nutrient uptake outer membrane protein [Chryseolinea sp.]|nr:RagB/SusD family nutrient uptake outer membrane protein [Chryseolinea sp.]